LPHCSAETEGRLVTGCDDYHFKMTPGGGAMNPVPLDYLSRDYNSPLYRS
jgi:hypothetical protein